MENLILDIGCGENKLKAENATVIGVDIRPEVNPDVICDVRHLPFPDSHFFMVYSSHTLEHIGRNEIFTTLKEWHRVLKVGGTFWVVVPNIEWAAEKILTPRIGERTIEEEDTVLSVLYGDQTYPENFHRMGFTKINLGRELELLGLRDITSSTDGYNLHMRAVK